MTDGTVGKGQDRRMPLDQDNVFAVPDMPVSSSGTDVVRAVRAGLIPLVDCAIRIGAVEKGFAQKENLELVLSRESSWSNIRDKLTIGQFDCAHILAGVAIASQLDLGNPMVPLVAPMSLGLNGNGHYGLERALGPHGGDGRPHRQ